MGGTTTRQATFTVRLSERSRSKRAFSQKASIAGHFRSRLALKGVTFSR